MKSVTRLTKNPAPYAASSFAVSKNFDDPLDSEYEARVWFQINVKPDAE